MSFKYVIQWTKKYFIILRKYYKNFFQTKKQSMTRLIKNIISYLEIWLIYDYINLLYYEIRSM